MSVQHAVEASTSPQPAAPPRAEQPSFLMSLQSSNYLSSWLTSMLLHAIMVVALAWMVLSSKTPQDPTPVVTMELISLEEDPVEIGAEIELDFSASSAPAAPEVEDTPTNNEQPAVAPIDPQTLDIENPTDLATLPDLQTPTIKTVPGAEANKKSLEPIGIAVGGGIEGRTSGRKEEIGKQRGMTPESETAVKTGLEWLAAHQLKNGGWWFAHNLDPCRNRCRNPGNFESTTASTALALLPFYGAGFTHNDGKYEEVVARGLYYLGNEMRETEHGGDFQNGSMYGQGLAAIVLCEAYAMSGDENLKPFAQAAVDFIEHAQHPKGGWRYVPGQPGDMTVTSWQIMALKSAKMAGLDVQSGVLYNATHFLDSLASQKGARYGYDTKRSRPSTTSMGLLLRMYTGWRREDPALVRGVQYLAKRGPSRSDMYYNYYATQVMSHMEGPAWERWNKKMREQLIQDQSTLGHEAGSWYYDNEHSKTGGRIYNTAMAILTLEVYYRYLPLYQPKASY